MGNEHSRVLIVDDMHINRIILSSLLASNGVSSDQVETGRECIELCRVRDYDLILLDHRMPDFDGVDTLIELKKIFAQKGREIPVICHTIEDGRKNINLYKAAGFADVLIKPIAPKELADVLIKYLPDNDTAKKYRSESQKREEVHTKDELDRLPLWLKTIPHINLVEGIEKCETAEDYMDALYVFASSIESKAAEIGRFFELKNWEAYTLKVHSLKSMSRLIGANHLSGCAAELEDAAREGDYDKLAANTWPVLNEYKNFIELLEPILTDYKPSFEEDDPDSSGDTASYDISKNILFIGGSEGIVAKGIIQNLSDEGFDVLSIADDPSHIISHRDAANIILYYPGGADEAQIHIVMNFLDELCRDEAKFVCLLGEPADIDEAASASTLKIPYTYPRPIDMTKFINDMYRLSGLFAELNREKNIFITDDDDDYRFIIESWLSDTYNVHSFSNAADTLDAIGMVSPDLLLLDYEMPERDGYELMLQLRSDPMTAKTPIIFLTGKSDRDHVVKILEQKPDGYLLKSTEKETLKKAIQKFFIESAFNRSSTEDLF